MKKFWNKGLLITVAIIVILGIAITVTYHLVNGTF